MRPRIPTAIDAFDKRTMLRARAYCHPLLTVPLNLLTYTGTGLAWVIVGAGLVALNRAHFEILPRQADLVAAMWGSLAAWFVGHWLKIWFARPRPRDGLENFQSLSYTPRDGSFPSSHASSSFSLFLSLLYMHHPLAPWAGVWCALITYSRFYLGVHYPSDLAGGLALGVLCSFASQPLAHLANLWL